MRLYRASSVVDAIRHSSCLDCAKELDLVACPVENCRTPKEKCLKKSGSMDNRCQKKLSLMYPYKSANQIAVLYFHYTISDTNYDGFIAENSTALRVLINRKAIDVSRLVFV
jgi:hypothetical protein